MHTLFLNLASHSGLLACVADDAIAASHPIDHRIDDSQLIPKVEEVLKKTGWSYRNLTHIACVVGPGGFTSLRVAVALANALSHELQIPSCWIHLSDLYFVRMSAETSPRLGSGRALSPLTNDALWLHSTKKYELFIRESEGESRCITLEELKIHIKKGTTWAGELIPEHRKIVDAAGAKEASLRPLEDVLPSFLQQRMYKKQILQPWYGRGW